MHAIIQVTVMLEGPWWVAIFERTDNAGFAAARTVFGKEPTDPELHQYILNNYQALQFTVPQEFKLVIKRKNPKRVQREVRREMEKAKTGPQGETFAQEVLRLELEKKKVLKKSESKAEKEAAAQARFQQAQNKKKKKLRGH